MTEAQFEGVIFLAMIAGYAMIFATISVAVYGGWKLFKFIRGY